MLNVPRHKVTVKCKRAGGAFGGKARIQCAYLAAAAAAKFGAPVRLVLERREDMEITGHRHEVIAGNSQNLLDMAQISEGQVARNRIRIPYQVVLG